MKGVLYSVAVHTEREVTNGKHVWVNLYGQHGDCGSRNLLLSKEHQDKFKEGQVDTFAIEAVFLGQLEKLQISLKNSNKG